MLRGESLIREIEKNKLLDKRRIEREKRKKQKEREKRKEQNKINRKVNRRVRWLKEKYNLTLDDYDYMLEQQHGVCAICKKQSINLVIDHDHNTGHVRGLLCNACNTGIGLLGDSFETVMAAVEYLQIKTR